MSVPNKSMHLLFLLWRFCLLRSTIVESTSFPVVPCDTDCEIPLEYYESSSMFDSNGKPMSSIEQ